MKNIYAAILLCLLCAAPALAADYEFECNLGGPNNFYIAGANKGQQYLHCNPSCTATDSNGRPYTLKCACDLEPLQSKFCCADASQSGWTPPFSNPALDYTGSDPCQ